MAKAAATKKSAKVKTAPGKKAKAVKKLVQAVQKALARQGIKANKKLIAAAMPDVVGQSYGSCSCSIYEA